MSNISNRENAVQRRDQTLNYIGNCFKLTRQPIHRPWLVSFMPHYISYFYTTEQSAGRNYKEYSHDGTVCRMLYPSRRISPYRVNAFALTDVQSQKMEQVRFFGSNTVYLHEISTWTNDECPTVADVSDDVTSVASELHGDHWSWETGVDHISYTMAEVDATTSRVQTCARTIWRRFCCVQQLQENRRALFHI